MTSTNTNEIFIELTEEQFASQFTLIPNHITPSAEWGDGGYFETYGEELDFLKTQDARCIWTILDDNDGNVPYLMSGIRWVNRLAYVVSREPVPENTTIVVHD